ncbi:hypothetical protein JCM3774_003670 [Rhodotorula dairenensis]
MRSSYALSLWPRRSCPRPRPAPAGPRSAPLAPFAPATATRAMTRWKDHTQRPAPYSNHHHHQAPPPLGDPYHPQVAAFWGPFQPSYPAFYPPHPNQIPLGLGDHPAGAGESHQQQQSGLTGGPNRHYDRFTTTASSSRSLSPNPHLYPHNPDRARAPMSKSKSAAARRPPAHIRHRERTAAAQAARRDWSSPSAAEEDPRPRRQEPEETAPMHAPDGSYLPPSRRQRRDTRHATVLPPTATYLAAADAAADPSSGGGATTNEPEPIALVMDLNHTLLCRAKRNRHASKMPVVRPYLATFLTYICTPRPTSPSSPARRRKFAPIVYSSARAPNVLSMLAAVNLIPPERLSNLRFRDPYEPDRTRRGQDVLEMVFTREMMGLSERDYAGDVETVKDLGKVWERLGYAAEPEPESEEAVSAEEEHAAAAATATATTTAAADAAVVKKPKVNRKAKARLAARRDTVGARRTLLLDDEAGKAAQQPYSHLPIAPFLLHPSEIPDGAAETLSPNPTPAFGGGVGTPPRGIVPGSNNTGGRTSRASSPSPSTLPFPSSPSSGLPLASSSGSALRTTAFYDPTAVALQVDARHPPAHDSHLLSTIWFLERLSSEPNLAYAIKHGALDRLREEARQAVKARKKKSRGGGGGLGGAETSAVGEDVVVVEDREVDDEMAQRGIAVCDELGITVSREWVPDWREKLLAKLGSGDNNPALPSSSSSQP